MQPPLKVEFNILAAKKNYDLLEKIIIIIIIYHYIIKHYTSKTL